MLAMPSTLVSTFTEQFGFSTETASARALQWHDQHKTSLTHNDDHTNIKEDQKKRRDRDGERGERLHRDNVEATVNNIRQNSASEGDTDKEKSSTSRTERVNNSVWYFGVFLSQTDLWTVHSEQHQRGLTVRPDHGNTAVTGTGCAIKTSTCG